jgi:hypothetical protein
MLNPLSRYALADVALPLLAVILLSAFIAWIRIRRPGQPHVRLILYVVLFYGIAEFGVFQNPFFFRTAYRKLGVDYVGFRQRDVLEMEVLRREKPWHAKYLAVGNSQTDAIYNPYVQDSASTRLFTLAGLSPLELPLCRQIIFRHCTNTVLLHLSEFDLAMEPRVDQLKMAPAQGVRDLWVLSRELLRTTSVSVWDILDLWAANVISPYRYNFVFRGVLKKLTHELDAFPEGRLTQRRGDFSRRQVDSLNRLDTRWFEANMKALDNFLAWCRSRRLKVVIVEGRYHPDLYAKNRSIHEKANVLLKDLCSRHPNARLLAVDDLEPLLANDYRDGVHVVPTAGVRFARRVIEKLEQSEKAFIGGTAGISETRRL